MITVMDKKFLEKYFTDFIDLLLNNKKSMSSIVEIKDILLETTKKGNKVVIVGNGASAAMASHVSVDLTKNAGVCCINFNEADLITCFANDYGYEHWVEKAVHFFGTEGDVLIAISSSGQSENILNGCRAARKKHFSKVITLSGFDANNPLREMGDINLWVDSRAYNHVESIHQLWLLAVVDLIIGKMVYSANPSDV